MINRGGRIMDTGTIGKLLVLRNDMLLPGERIKGKLDGKVIIEALRERDTVKINAHIATFLVPVRWCEPNWATIIKEGPSTASTISYRTDYSANEWGLGGDQLATYPTLYAESVAHIFNNYYRWPEDSVRTPDQLLTYEFKCINLPSSWTRCLFNTQPANTADYTVTAGASFTVQDLASMQKRFLTAQTIENIAHNRYINVMKELWGGKSSREVDKCPLLIDEAQLAVKPGQITATDGASLGSFASLYDFNVNYEFNVIAPEHCLLVHCLVIRFMPITESRNPLANNTLSWAELVGATEMLSQSPPVNVQASEVLDIPTASDFSLGGMPAGWQWRSGWDRVGRKIDARNSFPIMTLPSTINEARYASRRVDAFRSSSLGDFRVDLQCDLLSQSSIEDAMQSVTSGQKRGSKSEKTPGFKGVLK